MCGGEIETFMSARDLSILLQQADLETDLLWREASSGIIGIRADAITAMLVQRCSEEELNNLP